MNINQISNSPVAVTSEPAQKDAGIASFDKGAMAARVAKNVLGFGTYLGYASHVPGISNICNPTHLDYVAKTCGAVQAGMDLKDKINAPVEPPVTLARQAQKIAEVTSLATKVIGAAAVLSQPLLATVAPAAIPFMMAGAGYMNMVGQGASYASVGLKFLV